VRPALEVLDLEPPPIPSAGQGDIALWHVDVVGWIGSLPERLRQVFWTEGERIVNLVGNVILTRVHYFVPNFPFAQIFERFGSDSARWAAEEASKAAVAEVLAKLQERVSRHVPRA
jgi:hypothetical protein